MTFLLLLLLKLFISHIHIEFLIFFLHLIFITIQKSLQ